MKRLRVQFSPLEIKALRLLKRRHRPAAVEKALGMQDGRATSIRRQAEELGETFPRLPRSNAPITNYEYREACKASGILPDPALAAALALPPDMTPWPHQLDYPLPATPRAPEAGAQAVRILNAVQDMRYVPGSMAGGGERHFGRECAEHLAMLIAYAPGPRYRDDPRAARPEPRLQPSRVIPHSASPCALAGIMDMAS